MLFILYDRLIDITVVQHLAECLCDLHLFDLVLRGNTLHDLFGRGIDSEFAVNGQVVEILRDQLIIRLIYLRIGRDLI